MAKRINYSSQRKLPEDVNKKLRIEAIQQDRHCLRQKGENFNRTR